MYDNIDIEIVRASEIGIAFCHVVICLEKTISGEEIPPGFLETLDYALPVVESVGLSNDVIKVVKMIRDPSSLRSINEKLIEKSILECRRLVSSIKDEIEKKKSRTT